MATKEIEGDKLLLIDASVMGLQNLIAMSTEPPYVIEAMDQYLRQLLDYRISLEEDNAQTVEETNAVTST